MERIEGLDFEIKNSAVSLGKFDGIHRGHRVLLKEICSQNRGIPTVFTFSLEENAEKIYTQKEKDLLLSALGIKREIVFPFTEETRRMTPEEFIREILVRRMDVRFVCVGSDFRFGVRRTGDVELLDKFSKRYGYQLCVMPKVTEKNEVVSSTLIRSCIEQGKLEKANQLLGEPWFLSGRVQHGEELGRTIQFPTANLFPEQGKKLLPNGVYATTVEVCGTRYCGVTNIGKKPTVGDFSVGVETYIMDFSGDLYDQEIRVNFHQFLRPEIRFDSVEQLRRQIQADRNTAHKILTGQKP
ncbi:MAG: bifunctional riboflavin kinase/FAD synthetase [Clostridiaceae bacterium]|nr:bifunctional riboflavin kinase/FAD synthetase [Clostridiaceae bacterium]